jgi:hypothetical protein
MPNSETEIMDVTLTLKELGNGNQGFMLESSGKELSILGDNSFLMLELDKSVSFEDAKNILAYLNNRIVKISHTLIY